MTSSQMLLKGITFLFGTELRKLRYSGESRMTVPLELVAIVASWSNDDATVTVSDDTDDAVF